MITAVLFPFLKVFDLIKRIFVRKRKTVVTFNHPDTPRLMYAVYTREKEHPDSTFYVVASPKIRKWDEYIRTGAGWLHNQYYLETGSDHWKGKPNWRTFTASVINSFELDFSAPDHTTLILNGKKNITDSENFQSWFRYCRDAGVAQVTVVKHA